MSHNDLIQGLRSFARRPGFTSLLIFILALGIAFVTMVATLADSVFLGSVPYRDPERIVLVWRRGPEPIHLREATSYPNIRDWAAGGEPFFELSSRSRRWKRAWRRIGERCASSPSS